MKINLRNLAFAVVAVAVAAVAPCVLHGQSAAKGSSASQRAVRAWQDTITLPTYEEGLPDENPPFDQFVTNERYNYPYTMRENLTNRVTPHQWRALNLENEYLKCVILPDLGGHLYRCLDKRNGAEMFYANPSLKFARIAYRGVWAAYGIEFNFPVSHNWMTASPIDFSTSTAADGSASVWVRNIDRVYGMEWRVQLTLYPGQALLEQKTTLYNPSAARHRFYWWTNAGVQVWDDSKIYYPTNHTITHGFTDLDTWPVNRYGVDLSIIGNHKGDAVSRFSYASNEPYMAVYHPKTNAGVVHYSTRTNLPSKKFFSWGSSAEGLAWREALSDNHSAYVEIQAGLFRDQETYGFLNPQEAIHFTEIWLPIRDIGGVAYANDEAALNLTRQAVANADTVSLDVALNVAKNYPNAKLELNDGTSVVASETASLFPKNTYRKEFSGLNAKRVYTLTMLDSSGQTILRHTEGQYDFVPKSEIPKELPTAYVYPPADKRSENDFVELGSHQESYGQLLDAIETYQEGLRRYPESVSLIRATGRLEVVLMRYSAGMQHLSQVMTRVSTDKEASYYLGLAYLGVNNPEPARRAFEVSEQFGTFRAPSLFELAALDASKKKADLEKAHEKLQRAYTEFPDSVRIASLDVTLLRLLGHKDQAKQLLERLRQADPANTFLRYEVTRLGQEDAALWPHLASDPERILEIAVQYMHFGLYAEAVELLSRTYPSSGPGVVSEPGMPRPLEDPLIVYYRGYCREMMHQSGAADFQAAAKMSTKFVFPNRAETLDVLKRALAANPQDANAHSLLGELYMSGGMEEAAMREWNTAREINPAIPALLRNMGYTILLSKQAPERAVELFTEGIKSDPQNAENYLGLERALKEAGHPAAERAAALQKFPGEHPPALLTFQLARDLADAGRYEDAENVLAKQFVSLEEGGASRLDVYLEIKLKQAHALAEKQQCGEAKSVISHLSDPVPRLSLTKEDLQQALQSRRMHESVQEVETACGK